MPATGVLYPRGLVGVHDGHGVISRDAVSNRNSVLEELAHLVVEVAVSYKERCPYKGLVGVFAVVAGRTRRTLPSGAAFVARAWRAAARGGGALASPWVRV